MPLIDPVDPDTLDSGTRELLERLPDLPHFRLLAHAHSAFAPRHDYGRALMRELSIDDDVREAVILRVAGWVGCDYVRSQHEAAGLRAGLNPEVLEAAVAGREDDLPGEPMRAAVLFVSDMLERRGARDEVVRRAIAVLGEAGLVEVALVVERYLGLSLLLTSLQVPPAEPLDLVDVSPR